MNERALVDEILSLVHESRSRAARAVNAALVLRNWHIGNRIQIHILRGERAGYGEALVARLARQLTQQLGGGFGRTELSRMVKFAEHFSDPEIVATLSQQLGWSHFRLLLPLEDPLAREFYAEMARLERWSVRTLDERIKRMLFERTAIARRPKAIIRAELDGLREADRLSPDLVFRDPYVLDFLRLDGKHREEDLEAAILRELETFLLELGGDFAFVARQFRITVDAEDYYLDLLFYHRRMARLVAIELKLGRFRAADKGQMELYLRWLDRHERRPHESSPLGLILCAGKSDGHVELLGLGKSGIHVAEYLTELPPRELLEQKLSDAIHLARARLESSSVMDE